MAYIRCYSASLTTGRPLAAIIADEDDPADFVVAGRNGAQASVEKRWEDYLKRGLPKDHTTLLTTMSGSHTTITDWEPVGDDMMAAAEEAMQVIEAREPLPGVPVVP